MYTYRRAAAPRSSQPELTALLEKAVGIHTQLQLWINRFPGVLRAAMGEADDLQDKAAVPLVWQDRFVSYWHEITDLEKELSEIAYDVEGYEYPKGSANQALRRTIENTNPRWAPTKAKTEYAFDKVHFLFSTKLNRPHHIAYEVPRLQEWADAFEKWTQETKRTLVASIKFTR